MKKVAKKFLNEFKEFISRGNVVDLAVGVIMGSAFGKIVTSLVSDILMPLIGAIIGTKDFSELKFIIHNSEIMYGNFIQTVVDFLIVAFCIFLFVKTINIFKKKQEKQEEVKPSAEILLLTEIRDLLKDNKKNKNK